ncbi:hypothetical protein FRC06_004796, partial [Ceratobasidium sp. 370]
YDGNFSQVRKASKVDPDDLCLSNGKKYFVEHEHYQAHLKANDISSKNKSTVPNCNTMKAVANQFVKFKGLDVTGIGSVACRHGFFMHAGTVDFYGGER